MTASDNYRAYLLRMWRTPEGDWRASLENPHTGERRAFATLEQSLEFLVRAARSGLGAVNAEYPPALHEAARNEKENDNVSA